MTTTLFHAQLDGFNFLDQWRLPSDEFRELRSVLFAKIGDAEDVLRESFGGVPEILGVERELMEWVYSQPPKLHSLSFGMAATALDNYYKRVFFALRGGPGDVGPFDSSPEEVLMHEYIFQREVGGLDSTGGLVLASLAVARLIPEQWITSSILRHQLEQELGSFKLLTDMTAEFDLRLPTPGGNLWVQERTIQQWSKLKSLINRGRPWPIKLIYDSVTEYESETVVAYGYEKTGSDSWRLMLYVPSRGSVQIELLLEPTTEQFLRFNDRHSEDQYPRLLGFFCENYKSKTPPISPISKLFRLMWPMRIWWHVVRRYKLFKIKRSMQQSLPSLDH